MMVAEMLLSLNLVVIVTSVVIAMILPSHPANTPSICFSLGQCYKNIISLLFVSKSYT
jgi:hypothetical protein